jgi:hypothetical protein
MGLFLKNKKLTLPQTHPRPKKAREEAHFRQTKPPSFSPVSQFHLSKKTRFSAVSRFFKGQKGEQRLTRVLLLWHAVSGKKHGWELKFNGPGAISDTGSEAFRVG